MAKQETICTWQAAFVAEDLDPERREIFVEHLSGCDECRRTLAAMSPALAAYRLSTQAQLPHDGLSRLNVALDANDGSHRRRGQAYQYVAAAVLAVLLFGSGYWVGQGKVGRPTPRAVLHPLRAEGARDLPQRPQLSFTVAWAESIPATPADSGPVAH